MNKVKQLSIYVIAGVAGLGIIILFLKIVINNTYREQIPSIPDLSVLSAPIIEQLSLAYKIAHYNPTASNLGMLGMAYHSCACYDQAVQCYKLAIRKDKSKWVWSYYLGYLDQEMGDSKSSIENFNNVIRGNPKAYQAWYYLGKDYQNMASGDKAEEAFNKIAYLPENLGKVNTLKVNYSPLSIGAKFELARIYLNTNRLNDAERILTGIVQKNHTIGIVYRLLGNVYSAKGDSVLSRKYIVRAQDLPEVSPIVDTLADRLALMSRSELYLPKLIDDAIKSANPEWAMTLLNHALIYLPEDKYLISKAIKFFLRMGSGKEVLPYLNKNFNKFKDDFDEMAEVADLLFKKGLYLQAIPYFSQAKILKPENNELQASYAVCYWKSGKKDISLNLMNELYERNKDSSRVLANEVDFMLKVGQKKKARFYLTKLRQVAPYDPKVPKLAGMFAETEGNQKAAISLYEEAFKNDPTDLETAQKLGFLMLEQKMWDSEVNLFRNSLKYHPNEPFLLDKLGTLLIFCPDSKQRNLEEGLELSERAFYHIASPSSIIISAGKNLAQGNAMHGDFKTASFYMNITLNMARSENVPQNYMEGLINLARMIKQFNDRK